MTGDWLLDLAIADEGNSSVARLVANAPGSFGAPSIVPTPMFATPRGIALHAVFVTVADVDGDGRLDVVANPSRGASTFESRIAVLPGDGAGSLAPPTFVEVGQGPGWSVSADFDGDGRSDLATANGGGNSASVLLHRGALPYGVGTGGCAGAPALGISTPMRVNTPGFALVGTNAPPRSAGAVFLADRGDVLGSLAFGLRFHLALASPSVVSAGVSSDLAGMARLSLPVPNAPFLAGLGLVARAFWLELTPQSRCSRAALPVESSRGLSLRVMR